jgi:hypothetical protein
VNLRHTGAAAHVARPSQTHLATAARVASGVHTSPSGPAFTVVLLVHVGAALVGMIALVASAVSARRVVHATGAGVSESVRTYFSVGVNWAGRVLYLVPIAGAGLIGLSHGRDAWGDDWVVIGLVLWLVAAVIAEIRVWPSERRVQAALAGSSADDAVPLAATEAAASLWRWSAVVFAVLVAGMVVMFARP